MSNLTFGIVGEFQAGKSTLINCLLGRLVASVGDGTATTHTRVNYRYSSKEYIEIEDIFGNIHTIETIPQLQSITDDFLSILGKTEHCNQQEKYGIVSTRNNWGESNDIPFENHIGSWFFIKELLIEENDQFKIRINNDWTINYGASSNCEPAVLGIEKTCFLVANGNNITLPDGLYDVYFEINTKELYVVKSGEQTILSSITVYLNNPLLKGTTIVDMPGYGYNPQDNVVADTVLQHIDYAIVITTNLKSIGGEDSRTYKIISRLQQHNIPYYLFLNCSDTGHWTPKSKFNINIYIASIDQLNFYMPLLNNNGVPIVNLLWYWYSLYHTDPIFEDYKHLLPKSIEEYKHESNFNAIEEIFSMDNRAYLELKKEFKEELAKLKEELCPIGTIQAFAFNRIPKGWMVCDGSKLDPNVHHELFNAIGTTFGGDGENYFRLPDLRGRFIRGWNSNGEIDKERKFGSYQEDSLQNHSHELRCESRRTSYGGSHKHNFYTEFFYVFGKGNTGVSYINDGYTSTSSYTKKSVCSEGDHSHELPSMEVGEVNGVGKPKVSNENRPNNCALLYCIKVDPFVEGGIIPENDFILVNDQNDEPEMPCNSELSYKEIISRL